MKPMKQPNTAIGYDDDAAAWASEQAARLRAGDFHALDLLNLADEIEAVGKREKRELINRMAVLLMHLMKWQFQPDRRCTSWQVTIRAQRHEITNHLADNPSLKPLLSEPLWLDRVWNLAELAGAKETYIRFPATCPWSMAQALDASFWPESTPQ